MSYIDTLHVKLSPDGFYRVHGGFLEAVIGEKNNYFKYHADCSSREAKAIAGLGFNTFPKEENKHETQEQAEAWLRKYAAHAKKVIELPRSLKVGHSCEHWK